ncbi:MAG TPA: CARDB domain-containing protein [Actinomycetota bacterium]|nr:CARDB domain-containing protein [Actinomycetota bacterium]
MKFRKLPAILVASVLLTVGVSVLGQPAAALPNPVATTDAELLAYGRVFPDPQGCLAYGVPDDNGDGVKDTPKGVSPYAKGQVCAEQFLGYDEVIAGVTFLEEKFSRYVQVIRLDEAYDDLNYRSAGLPTAFGRDDDGNPQVLSRDRRPLYLFKITDSKSSIAEKDRHHFAYSLSIHGIERAGVEGGIRAMEDLVTWAACEPASVEPRYTGLAPPACAVEGPFPKKIVETPPDSNPIGNRPLRAAPTAGHVLENSVIYFIPPNPDGWRRGAAGEGGVYFQRYNGNGVDLNRDWPTLGYTYRPYSPGSEPETEAYAEVLKGIRGTTAKNRFTGGIDLHGQLLAVAFSFTLLGASEKDYRKNFSTVDQSLRTWRDQTKRLSWSPYIADENQNGVSEPEETCPEHDILARGWHFPYCYADQWGTVNDTIDYQITGGFGDWFESPIGLDAVGLDNEMSMSHITPNNVYDPVNEQMHVDGNKGLIYSQLASMLTEQDADYEYKPSGKIGYVFDPDRLQVAAGDRPKNPGLPAQKDIDVIIPCETDCGGGRFAMEEEQDEEGNSSGPMPTLYFDVLGIDRGYFNRGITVDATFTNAQGISPTGSFPRLELQTFIENQWQTVQTSFVQGGDPGGPDLYLQAAQTVSVLDPQAGQWRVRFTSDDGGPARVKIDFRADTSEEGSGQAAIDVSSMDFFEDLNKYVPEGSPKLSPVTVEEILANPSVLDRFDSLVVVDDFMPGFPLKSDAESGGKPQDSISFDVIGPPPGADDAVHEFTVLGEPDAQNDRMVVTSSWEIHSDWDVTLERQRDNGTWEDKGCHCSFIATGEQISVTTPEPGRYRVLVHNFAAVPQPVHVDVKFFSEAALPDKEETRYTPDQFDDYAGALAAFAVEGGNLILTDGALRGLKILGIATETGKIGASQPSGQGAVPRYEMNLGDPPGDRGNLCTPDSPDPLLKDVCLPGTAGGTARQSVEPVPIGYSPDATLDGAKEAKLSQFFVDRAAWEKDCGKPNKLECTSALLGSGVGLGERHFGEGRIRIAGSMLPDPNYAPGGPRDMRFGLASYALTFSAWQMFLNLVNYERPPIDVGVSLSDSPDPVTAGEVLTYTVEVSNNTGQSAPGAQVTDQLPAGVSLVSASASQGTCSGSSTVTCNLGRLAGNGSATMKIEVRPSQAGSLTNTVSVSSDRADSNADNDSASTTTEVKPAPAPDLKPASLSASKSTIRRGQKVVLTTAIQNIGTKDAQNVRVQFKEGSTQIGTIKTITSIAAGGAETASVTWTPRTRGQRTITVVVDPANAIGELNEDNNNLSRVFTVR